MCKLDRQGQQSNLDTGPTCVGCQAHKHGQRQDRRLRLVCRLFPSHCVRRRLKRPSRHCHLVQPPVQAELDLVNAAQTIV